MSEGAAGETITRLVAREKKATNPPLLFVEGVSLTPPVPSMFVLVLS